MSQAKRSTFYVSVSIVVDGPSPAKNSMLSVGAVIFDANGAEIENVQMNMLPRAGAKPDKRYTEVFWAKHPEVKAFVSANPQLPKRFAELIDHLVWRHQGHDLEWVVNPAAHDWQWVKFYYDKYKTKGMPGLGCYSVNCVHSILRAYGWIKSLTPMQESEFEDATMKQMQMQTVDHVAHNPMHDARVQGEFFFFLQKQLKAEQ